MRVPMKHQNVVVAPRSRGELSPSHLETIRAAQHAQSAAQHALEQAIVSALREGASVRAITAATGIAGTTVQRYANKHGR